MQSIHYPLKCSKKEGTTNAGRKKSTEKLRVSPFQGAIRLNSAVPGAAYFEQWLHVERMLKAVRLKGGGP